MTETPNPSNAEAPADPIADPTLLGGDTPPAGDKPEDKAPDDDGDGKPDGSEPEVEAPEATGAPEKYELKAPEGTTLDDAMLEAVTPVFQKLGLSNEGAQELADAYAKDVLPKLVEQVQTAAQQQAIEDVVKIRKDWTDAWKADAEIGGAEMDAKRAVMAKAIDDLVGPKGSEQGDSFRTFLNDTGLGNNPDIARLLYRAGTKLQEAEIISAERGGSSAKSTAEKMYGKDYIPPEQRT